MFSRRSDYDAVAPSTGVGRSRLVCSRTWSLYGLSRPPPSVRLWVNSCVGSRGRDQEYDSPSASSSQNATSSRRTGLAKSSG